MRVGLAEADALDGRFLCLMRPQPDLLWCGSTGSNSAEVVLWQGTISHCLGVGSIARAQPHQKLILRSATGDHFYKRNKNLPPEEQMISALPDIKVLTINDDHDFMVIACDGIW